MAVSNADQIARLKLHVEEMKKAIEEFNSAIVILEHQQREWKTGVAKRKSADRAEALRHQMMGATK